MITEEFQIGEQNSQLPINTQVVEQDDDEQSDDLSKPHAKTQKSPSK
jgi:hypothetical protein